MTSYTGPEDPVYAAPEDPVYAAPEDGLLADLLAAGLAAAGEAGRLLWDGRRTGYQVGTKSTATDMVTAMDRAAEEAVVAVLGRRRPGDAVVGEEGTSREGASGIRWLVDPLDGTTNYLYDVPAWCVSLAAERDGTVVVGVVRDPTHGETYTAVRGGGAWLWTDGAAEPRPLRRGGEPGRVPLRLPTALVGTGFAYAASRRAAQAAVLTHLLPNVRDIRRLGSAALDLCAVAAGRLDAYYESGTEPWDRAAGLLVAAEAGCWVGGRGDEPASVALSAAAAPEIAVAFRRLLDEAGAAAPAEG
jgi:fructose-1,6-bisphosphatase/inositol monophosphatase family enzyme